MAVSMLACCVVLMLYHHVGYPFLLGLLVKADRAPEITYRGRRVPFRLRSP